ncbi:BMP family ABC transporter substrate-binding protein, partial [Listeria monocytogenes]|nr:BMP family ABC transporter substrate-binding protein [Listeria monocytogenes]
MKKAKLFSLGIVAVAGLTLLGACGGGNSGSTDSTGGGSADGTT